uniref:Uncharacterized protein n=1 Tax=Cryptomonas curvata TaxID=233186 RepID=A0A7S0QP60_9CRYP|mmetsp:Transcript_46553/g.97408  ORF Transcript_46553/g.97408 Transcript_46553/m.97408 type:complete len:102 (+) Transcript_46553:14-319(+)
MVNIMLSKEMQNVYGVELSFLDIQKFESSCDLRDHGRDFGPPPSFPQPLPSPKGFFCRGGQNQRLALESADANEKRELDQNNVFPAFRKKYNKMIGITAHL